MLNDTFLKTLVGFGLLVVISIPIIILTKFFTASEVVMFLLILVLSYVIGDFFLWIHKNR